MTIKWGDPIECNGVRPDWLRGRQPLSVDTDLLSGRWLYEDVGDVSADTPVEDWAWSHSDGKPNIRRFKLPADHPAYVALARGFHPWSGGESAPDDWDGGAVLVQDAFGEPNHSRFGPREISEPRIQNWSGVEGHARIIGYRKRNTRFDEPHLARVEVEGSAPVEGVFIKRMTEAEATEFANKATFDGLGHTAPCYAASGAHACLKALGLIRPESRAERFTRETGHAVTEAVEAALNWKES